MSQEPRDPLLPPALQQALMTCTRRCAHSLQRLLRRRCLLLPRCLRGGQQLQLPGAWPLHAAVTPE